jgi:hypothetical protein
MATAPNGAPEAPGADLGLWSTPAACAARASRGGDGVKQLFILRQVAHEDHGRLEDIFGETRRGDAEHGEAGPARSAAPVAATPTRTAVAAIGTVDAPVVTACAPAPTWAPGTTRAAGTPRAAHTASPTGERAPLEGDGPTQDLKGKGPAAAAPPRAARPSAAARAAPTAAAAAVGVREALIGATASTAAAAGARSTRRARPASPGSPLASIGVEESAPRARAGIGAVNAHSARRPLRGEHACLPVAPTAASARTAAVEAGHTVKGRDLARVPADWPAPAAAGAGVVATVAAITAWAPSTGRIRATAAAHPRSPSAARVLAVTAAQATIPARGLGGCPAGRPSEAWAAAAREDRHVPEPQELAHLGRSDPQRRLGVPRVRRPDLEVVQ